MANKPLKTIKFPGLADTYTIPQIDTTLAVAGKAADAKATGDAIADVVEDVTAIEASLPSIENASLAAYATDTAEGAIVTVSDGADGVPVKSLTVEIEPVQSGSGDPSPSNVRPITGWSQAKVTRTGRNLLDPDVLTTFGATYVSSINYTTEGKVQVKPSTQYVLSFSGSVGDGRILQYDASGNQIGSVISFTSQPYYFTTDARCVSIGFRYKFTETSGATVADSKAQMEIGSTASSYEAYQGQTYEIDLDGTRYGGTLDVTNGVLTVTHGIYRVTTAGSYDSTGKAINFGSISDAVLTNYIDVDEYKCVALSPVENIATVRDDSYDNVFTVLTGTIWAKSSTWSSGSDAQTFINNNNVDVIYPLATPLTVQLTAKEVTTLLGTNNIFADCGDVEVEYRADTKLYIDKLLNA